MAKQDELTSTERLLELIRDESPPNLDSEPSAEIRPAGERLKRSLRESLSFGRETWSVGVDVGHDDVKLVKVKRISERKIELADYRRVPLDPEVPRDHPSFHQFLRSALLGFCGSPHAVEIWATIPSARVETRYIKVPRVSPKQLPNAVFWSYQKQSAFDEKETIFDFEVLGDAEEGGVKKTAVMAYIAPRKEVDDLRELFARAGFPLAGVSIVPFAVQTLLRTGRIRAYGAAVSSLYIGRDWSRIDIFAGNHLVLSRGIKAGIRTMVEALQREIEQNWFELSLAKSPTTDQNRIRAIKARLKQEMEAAQNLFFRPVYASAGEPADDRQLAVKEERIFQMILPALERLVRQMERTIRHFALNFDNARVEKIYLSSGIQPHPRILDYIGEELGLPIEEFDPFAADDGFTPLPPPPDSVSERGAFAPAFGMALATNATTPNFLFTYKNKTQAANTRRVNRTIFACFLALILGCAGVAFWQEQQIKEKELQKLGLQQQLAGFEVRVDKNLILKLVDRIRARNLTLQGAGNHLVSIAVLGEIANTAPPNVRLLSVSARLGPAGKAGAPGKAEGSKKVLVVEGLVSGERATLEADLAAYLMTLKGSPLFRQPTISKKSLEMLDNQPVIRFTAQMDVV